MGRLRFYFDGLVHFFVAHSRHGTHSPFVFRLVDEVIYAKRRPGEPRDKMKRLVSRLIDRFRPATVYTVGQGGVPAQPLDFVVINGSELGGLVAQAELWWPQLHAGSVLVLIDCHRTFKAKILWQSIKAKPDVTVTIDLFRVGLVFFHAGQSKEDFKIRY